MKKNVLIITANGREHALATAYAKSDKVKKVIMIPGNGLTKLGSNKIKNYPDINPFDFDAILPICKIEKINFVDVSQDDCIFQGYVDKFQKVGISAFGPTQKAAEIEWNKDWARDFMKKYNLPIPHYESFTDEKKAIEYIKKLYRHPGPDQGSRISLASRVHGNDNILLYIKAAGLAGGKGAIRAQTTDQAITAIKSMKQFGKAGETFLIEEGMIGEEFSLFAICDGTDYVIAKAAQDHKTVYNKDHGPNTGGMGCVAPPRIVTKKILAEVEKKILKPFMNGMQKEGRPYRGILYLGGMIITRQNYSSNKVRSSRKARTIKPMVKIIEFNARWGDPEAEVIIPSIQTDYMDLVDAVLSDNLKKIKITFDKKVRISIAGCSMGYPDDYSQAKDKEIFGLIQASKLPGITIFGAGIKSTGKKLLANGGRVFHVVAEGETVIQARVRAYGALAIITIEGNNLHYRTDIGWRDVIRMYSNKNSANISE